MIPIPIPKVDTEKKPDHVGEGLLQGLNKWCDHVGDGAQKLWRAPQDGHEREGALGAAKGVGVGVLGLGLGIHKGACDFLGSTLEGVRHTPDAVADKVSADRVRDKHGVEGEGSGDLLESYIEEEKEPEHLGEGLMSGAQGLGRGISRGFTDLWQKPMEGAQEGGALGFAQGAGKGLLGFATKTGAGTLDFATSVLKGAKNTPDAVERAVQSHGASGSSSGYAGAAAAGAGGDPIPTFGGQGRVLGSGDSAPPANTEQ